ncbi:MAG: DUF305 domain-containing protein [Xanthobacteraceae bacterium]|nr:DUF305 domain-containing protein [Xanthobacteraceae bacterium]
MSMLAAAAAALWLLGQSLDPAARSETHAHPQRHPAEQWSSAMGFPRSLYEAAMRMHEDMLRSPPTGNADVDFLVQMIPHHEGAVEMARLYLGAGNDPLVRRLAEEIIAGQQAEITAMKARLEILRKGADPNPGGFPSLGSSRGQ